MSRSKAGVTLAKNKPTGKGADPGDLNPNELSPDDAMLREFFADLYAAISRMRDLRRAVAKAADLSSSEYSVLLAVWHLQRKASPTVRAIADHLHVAPAHTTAEIGRLVERGLLEKKPHPSDKRAVAMRLTSAGEATFVELAPILRAVNSYLLANVSHKNLAVVHRFLSAVIDQAPSALSVAEALTPSSASSASKATTRRAKPKR